MNHHPAIFAHRGARIAAPENTLPAFQAALDMHADGVELDVHCSKDGQLMVIHDFDVDATTDEQQQRVRQAALEGRNMWWNMYSAVYEKGEGKPAPRLSFDG
jgi:glycerophosphoryl diester phosphodiesterase